MKFKLIVFVLILSGASTYQIGGQPAIKSHIATSKPEPGDWFAGDIHVHRSCDGSIPIPLSELQAKMGVNDLDVISVLSDIGNSQAPDRIEDLQKVDGNDSPLSGTGRIIHFSAEWHWDANEWERPHQALGGHLVLLGLKEANKIWNESPYKILEWSKKQEAISGFAHMQYLNDSIPDKLNCCIPVDFPVEAAFGMIDFVSEDCDGGDAAVNAYYKLLNCGFRIGLAAGTDYPCNGGAPFGTLLTYVQINDRKLTYKNWIEGIKKGNTVISRNGHYEFLELKANGNSIPGDEIKFKDKGIVAIKVKWTAVKEMTGRIELVCNGKVVATRSGITKAGKTLVLEATPEFTKSGWICARRMDDKGHQTHTAPIYITVNDKPVRASTEDADFFIKWIDNILNKITPEGTWNQYFPQDLETVQIRYRKAREIYSKIYAEAQSDK